MPRSSIDFRGLIGGGDGSPLAALGCKDMFFWGGLILLVSAVAVALVARRMDPVLIRAQDASRDPGPDWQGTDTAEVPPGVRPEFPGRPSGVFPNWPEADSDHDTLDFPGPGKGGPHA